MRPKLLLLLILISFNSFGQITLEKTYTNVKQLHLRVAKIDPNTLVYYTLNDLIDQIEIFDINHTPIKTINIPANVRNGRGYIRVLHLSKFLFDTDDQYEYSVSFFNESGSTYFNSFYVLNEDGSVLLDGSNFDASPTVGSGNLESYGIFKTQTGALKLVLSNFSSDTSINSYRIYGLPGETYELSLEERELENEMKVMPNPTISNQNVVYHGNINKGKIHIYSQSGRLLKTITIDPSQKESKIDISDFSSGIYFYQVYEGNQKVGIKKVIIN